MSALEVELRGRAIFRFCQGFGAFCSPYVVPQRDMAMLLSLLQLARVVLADSKEAVIVEI